MWKKTLIVLVVLAILSLTVTATFLLGTYSKISVRPWGSNPSPTPTESPIPDRFNQGRTHTTLLLGYGGGNHQGGLLTDTMMLAIIHPESETITLLSLPRDLWVDLPVSGDALSGWKINAAYAIGSDDKGYKYKPKEYTGPAGGGQLAKYAVKEVTGLDVDRFVSVNFSGFRRSVDVLNGVDVTVERSFVDPVYPIEGKENDTCGKSPEELAAYATMAASVAERELTCRYETLRFEKGVTHMDGPTALKYVRSRHSSQDGTDFGRAARQRNLILAMKDKVFRIDFFPKIIPFVNTLSDDVRTDYAIGDMQEFLKYKDELAEYKIVSTAISDDNVLTTGRSPNGQSIVLSKEGLGKWDTVKQFVELELDRTRYPEKYASESATATPSASVKPATQMP
jgi:polyisoprenyl-teichoic acid--peptidoglycan teichoic acid transferase